MQSHEFLFVPWLLGEAGGSTSCQQDVRRINTEKGQGMSCLENTNMKVSPHPGATMSATVALASTVVGTNICPGSCDAVLGWDRGARNCRGRWGMEKQLPMLSGVSFTCSALSNFLCQGWLMVSAAGQGRQRSQAPRAAPCDDSSTAATTLTSVPDFLSRKAGSTDLWPQGYSSQCLQDITCDQRDNTS